MMGEEGGLHVSVGTFFQDGIGASCAWIKRPDGVVFTQGWVLGEDRFSGSPPTIIREAGLLHGLSLVSQCLQGDGVSGTPRYIIVHSGNFRVIRQLRQWFECGTLRLCSAMASESATSLTEIAPKLE